MKKYKASILTALLLAAITTWGQAQQKALTDTSFMQVYCACSYDQIDGFFDKGRTPARTTLDLPTLVYAYPDKKAMIIDTIAPFTNVTLLKEGIDTSLNIQWIEAAYGFSQNGVYKENTGYIIDTLLSIGNVKGNTSAGGLDLILGRSPLLDKDFKQPRFRLHAVSRANNSNHSKLLKVQSYDLNIGAVDYYNHFYLTSVYNNALQQMPNLLRLYWHHGESCPESEGHVFIFAGNGKMSELISASTTGEAGFYEFTKVYIPLKFNNGKVLLVENGDSEHMFNTWDATLKTIPYPKDCNIPITELIVSVEESGEEKTDAKGNIIIDKNGNTVMLVTHKIIRYYRWDGAQLKEVKKIVIKQGN